MCIFCDIVEGKIPSYKVYEDEDVLAFLDISQVTKGHTLVIPKKHSDDFTQCEENDMIKVMQAAQTISQHLMMSTNAKGMHVLSNVHEAAGQSVKHFHVHLIPRYDKHDACVIEFQESEAQDLAALQQALMMK